MKAALVVLAFAVTAYAAYETARTAVQVINARVVFIMATVR